MRWLRRRLVAGLVLAALGRMGAGQQVEDQQLPPLQTAGDLGAEIFAQARATGMVLVLVNRTGGIFFKGYGEAMPGSGIVPGQESVVRLCSLTKIFTADVLARMLADRKVKLGDSLQSWEPGWASEELLRVKGAVMLPAPRTLKRGRARARETGEIWRWEPWVIRALLCRRPRQPRGRLWRGVGHSAQRGRWSDASRWRSLLRIPLGCRERLGRDLAEGRILRFRI